MRLAYLVSQYPAISHTFISREVQALRSKGIEIQVASINASDVYPEEGAYTFYVKKQGPLRATWAICKRLFISPIALGRCFFFAMRLGGWDLKRLLYQGFYLAEAALVGDWMGKQGLDHIHVHFANPACHVALLASKLFPIRYSITVHGPEDFLDGYLKEKIEGAHFVVAISHHAKSQLMRFVSHEHWEKMEMAHLGVDLIRYAPRPLVQRSPITVQTPLPISAEREALDAVTGDEGIAARLLPRSRTLQMELRSQPKLGGGSEQLRSPLQCLSIGRLVPNKGQRLLLQAFSLFFNQGGAAHLHLVGDGPDKMALKEEVQTLRLESSVTFHGALNQDQTHARLLEADLFVLASLAEGLPVVLMEAMAMEIPCIATAINGIPELIRNENEGILVMPADVEALAAALKRLSQESDLRRNIGRSGRRRVEQHFDLNKNTTHLSEIFYNRLGK